MERTVRLICMNALVAVIAVTLLAGCSGSAVTHKTLVDVPVPVAQPCVDGDRPETVKPLKEQITPEAWGQMDVRQKSALVGKQGLDLRTYGENLNAATGGCK